MDQRLAILLTFAVYLAVLLVVGALAYRRTHDLSDYLLGGRRLGSFVTALSAEASDMSGWLLLGLPGLAYAAGSDAAWMGLGLLVGTYANWRFLAPRLRAHPAALGESLTLSRFLERRFDDRTRVLRVVAAVFTLVFFLFYTSSGLVAGAKLFDTVFGLPYPMAVVVGALTILAYTAVGGFLAVCWTDVIQGLLMLAALLAVPIAALSAAGGWGHAIAAIQAREPALLDPLLTSGGRPLSLVAFLSLVGWGLGYFGQPHILARFMAVRSPGHVARARRIAMTWVVLTMGGAVLVGLAGIVVVDPPLTGPDVEKVFILLVGSLMHPIPAGVCLAAILAAVMSTVDSQLLVASSALAEDLYRPLIRRGAGPRELLWVGRLAVVLIAVAALLLALDPDNRVLELVAYAWAGFGASFGPTLLFALYWRRMTRAGALAGMITGGVTVILWKQLEGGIFDLYELVPGFLLSALAIVLASLASRPPAPASDTPPVPSVSPQAAAQ